MSKITICILLSAFLCSHACASPLSKIKAQNIEAELVEKIEGNGLQFFSVSPDGKFLAAYNNDGWRKIQIIEQKTMKVMLETPVEIKSFDSNYFQWSPDSQKAVVTENFLWHMVDSDLWILDISGKEIYQLFPDEVKNVMFADESDSSFAEFQPTWSPDSQSLFVSRTQYHVLSNVQGIVPFYKESVFNEIPALHHDLPYLSWGGGFWRENYLYFTWDASEQNNLVDGLYRILADGKDFEKIAGSDQNWGELRLADVSRDEKFALAEYLNYRTESDSPPHSRQSHYRLINLSDFTVELFKEAGESDDPFLTKWAVFSPSGNKILSVHKNLVSLKNSIMLRDVSNHLDYEIISDNEEEPLLLGIWVQQFLPPIFWTSDDFLYIAEDDGNLLLKYKLRQK